MTRTADPASRRGPQPSALVPALDVPGVMGLSLLLAIAGGFRIRRID